jgi:hypothetical protein
VDSTPNLDHDAIRSAIGGAEEVKSKPETGEATGNETIHPEIARLITLDDVAYEQRREEAAKKLDIKPSRLDRLVERARRAMSPSNVSSTRTPPRQTIGREGAQGCSNGSSNTLPVRTAEELYKAAKDIISAPDILTRVDEMVEKLGYAGDRTPVLLTYVALTSRLLDKPINEHVIAQSAAGKNYTVNTALALVPEEAVLKMTASTPKALIYSGEDLRHRTVVLAECDTLLKLEGNAATLIRSIIEDARTDYDVVEKDPETGHSLTRRVTKEGPTGLITTGVRDLELQTSTRVLNVYLPDTPEQTRAILQAEAAIASGRAVAAPADLIAQFQDFQRWLATQPSAKVVVPFAEILVKKVPAGEVRMRRDFKQLLAVIKTIALLNQQHRKRDASDCIKANLADYRWARLLLLATFKSITGGGITDAIRQTVASVPEGSEGVAETELVRTLGLSKSTVHYRVSRALRGGWIRNLETRKGHPFRLVRSAPLPEDDSPLPTVEELESQLSGFEHPADSNGYSNSYQTLGGAARTEQEFESSNEVEDVLDAREFSERESGHLVATDEAEETGMNHLEGDGREEF